MQSYAEQFTVLNLIVLPCNVIELGGVGGYWMPPSIHLSFYAHLLGDKQPQRRSVLIKRMWWKSWTDESNERTNKQTIAGCVPFNDVPRNWAWHTAEQTDRHTNNNPTKVNIINKYENMFINIFTPLPKLTPTLSHSSGIDSGRVIPNVKCLFLSMSPVGIFGNL